MHPVQHPVGSEGLLQTQSIPLGPFGGLDGFEERILSTIDVKQEEQRNTYTHLKSTVACSYPTMILYALKMLVPSNPSTGIKCQIPRYLPFPFSLPGLVYPYVNIALATTHANPNPALATGYFSPPINNVIRKDGCASIKWACARTAQLKRYFSLEVAASVAVA